MKLSIAVALSHHSELLILDEATSGLDPVVRDDILDMFRILYKTKTIPFWYLPTLQVILKKLLTISFLFITERLYLTSLKDELKYKYGIIKCGAATI